MTRQDHSYIREIRHQALAHGEPDWPFGVAVFAAGILLIAVMFA